MALVRSDLFVDGGRVHEHILLNLATHHLWVPPFPFPYFASAPLSLFSLFTYDHSLMGQYIL
jgi:hypothetical protein